MHPLPAAQATAASLHALLRWHEPKSPDEQLVINAVVALWRWANPDERSVPTRLRLRRSLPLRIRVKSLSAEAALVTKRGKRRNVRSRCGRRSTNSQLGLSQGTRAKRARTTSSTKYTVDDGVSQRRSSSNPSSQVVNFSDLSTEPPEGWPKLADLSSPVFANGTAVLASEKGPDEDRQASGTPVIVERQNDFGEPLSSHLFDGQTSEPGPKEESPHSSANATSPTKSVAKRRRVSPRIFNKDCNTENVKPDSGPVGTSPGSTRGIDSPADSPSMKESDRDGESGAQHASARKKCARKRKSSVPKRRRPATLRRSPELPFCIESRNDHPGGGETPGIVDSPPPSFDVDSPVRPSISKSAHSNRNTESPAISVTQKSKEPDVDTHSNKSSGPVDSLGSVVVGSASYDGRSVDIGYNRTSAKQEDIPSRPSSVVWNDSNIESIEEPPTGDQSVQLFDSIEETDKLPRSALQQSAEKSHHSDASQDHGNSNAAPKDVKNECRVDRSSPSDELITPAALPEGPDQLMFRESKKSSMASSLLRPGRCEEAPNPLVSTPVISDRNIQDIYKTTANRLRPNHISPVSPDDLSCKKQVESTEQQAKFRGSSEASFDEMVVCIANFTNDIESELAHEIVMRLGGEIVSNFEDAHPKCVVAPVDQQTKEAVNREMVIHFALASGVPIVSLPWLTQCFMSGCWVDFKDFETPSSRLKPNPKIFTGVAATFEDAFSSKNARRQCREYRDDVDKLIVLAGGVVIEKSEIAGVTQNDKSIRLHIEIAYDFDNDCLNTAPQESSNERVPMRIINKSWISACLFSGQCPPP